MPTKWVRAWICCPKHFQRNVTDPKGPANFQKPLQWNLPFIISFQPTHIPPSLHCLSVYFTGWFSFLLTCRERSCQKLPRSIRLPCLRQKHSSNRSSFKMCQTHKVRPPSQLTFRVSKTEKQKARGEDDTPAESSINTIPGDQKVVSGFLPYCRGDLETSTSSSQAFLLQAGHRDTFNKTRADAAMGSKVYVKLYLLYYMSSHWAFWSELHLLE